MNKLCRGPLGYATYQISRLYALWFLTRKFFHVFPICVNVKHVTPRAGLFWSQWHIINKLGRGPPDDDTYQLSKLYAMWFQTRRFFHNCPYVSPCKTCDPSVGPFWPLGRGPLGNQGSRPCGFRQDFFTFSLYKPM